jgi:ubiquitin-activating enzyme E1
MTYNFDINLYDRQIRTYGYDAVTKITTSSVLIYGLSKGLGTEIGKNLSLGGIKNIYLYDDNDIIIDDDLETGFYYNQNDLGKSKTNLLINKFQELNPYINVKSVDNFKQLQHVTILINQSIDLINIVNKYTRSINSKLICVFSKCIDSIIFVDAGEEHIINDIYSEIIDPVEINNISHDGIITCISHNFQTNDYIKFDNLKGENLDYLKINKFQIEIINKSTFKLKNYKQNNSIVINGTINLVKNPIITNNKTFETFILENNLINNWLINEQINCELIPVVSLIGSITSSEAIKLITNKYTPINQIFNWNDESLISHIKYNNDMKTTLGKLYGFELENKIFNSKIFIVGCGAIGCEYLKNLAFMGFNNIIITDPDIIEKSNLNRQFLFKNKHIGEFKSIIAANSIKLLKQINIKAFTEKVDNDNIIFTDNIFNDNNLTCVLNALDNITARKFMDNQCFKYNIPLFECGTNGTKGNVQPIIPFITETYSASSDQEQDKTFPMCTIKSFPNEIHHTIHWALDKFEMFNRIPLTINKWINNPNYLLELNELDKKNALDDINILTIKYPILLDKNNAIKLAIDMFYDDYYNNIIQLLHIYNPDYQINNNLFWSGTKKCPSPITYNINNDIHIEYILLTSNLLLKCCNILPIFTTNDIILYSNTYIKETFIPKDIKIASNDKELLLETKIENDIINIGDRDLYLKFNLNSLEFNKDNDEFIKWINITSNLRALNYNINTVSNYETKGIAGKIIPAIATTTSSVSGLVMLEILKYLLNLKIDNYRSTFLNLADPLLVFSEPLQAPLIEINNIKINSWEKFNFKINSSILNNNIGPNGTKLIELKEYYEKLFNTNIIIISNNNNILYYEDLNINLLDNNLLDIITNSNDNTIICLSNDDNIEIPTIYII